MPGWGRIRTLKLTKNPKGNAVLIFHHAHAKTRQLCGSHLLEATWPDGGITAFNIFLIDLDVGACLPSGEHAGQMVVVVLVGQGKLRLPSGPQRFAAPCTLFIPPKLPFEIENNASTSLRLVMVCTRQPRERKRKHEREGTEAPAWPVDRDAMAPSGDAPAHAN
jgi:mannose-6-phosphate isomerase-like protein (cupin superfamily)